jgi:hypothetical protein
MSEDGGRAADHNAQDRDDQIWREMTEAAVRQEHTVDRFYVRQEGGRIQLPVKEPPFGASLTPKEARGLVRLLLEATEQAEEAGGRPR